jgi:hypothetical protein
MLSRERRKQCQEWGVIVKKNSDISKSATITRYLRNLVLPRS